LGVIGICASFYFFNQSNKSREPVFIIDSVRTEILTSNRISDVPIKIIKNDGTQITKDLTSIRFYFWNKGKESIKRSNVLESVKISIDDKTAEIIGYKLLKTSREISNITILPDQSDNKSLIIDFYILEQNDGATGQIIYEGNPNSKFIISGTIEGVKQIETNDTIANSPTIIDYLKSFKILLPIIVSGLFIYIMFELGGWVNSIISKIVPKKIHDKLGNIMIYFVVICFVSLCLYSLIIYPLKETKKNIHQSLNKMPPVSIVPWIAKLLVLELY